ncbi:MAG: universal stress protein [Bacteroidia bacterium]|nr:universal stress protein [Bacteroidia bacterium]
MNKIIVPIDFSQHSEFALEVAAGIAKKNNAELLVLHMLELSSGLLTKSSNQHQTTAIFLLKIAEAKFEEFLKKDYLDELKVTPIVKHFKVFSEVNDVAMEHDADLVVMGSHGTSGSRDIFIGSNTEKVVRNSDIPVFVVKNRLLDLKLEEVVFACDFKYENIRPYLNATKLFRYFDSNINLLYVNLPNENFRSTTEIDSRIADFLMKADGNLDNMKNVHYQADYSVERGIINFSNKVGADIIAIPTHGRKGIAHFFTGSVGEDVANHSALPVITFKI